MAVSFDFRHLAMFGSNGILWVGTADLNQVFCEVNANQRPLQLVGFVRGACFIYVYTGFCVARCGGVGIICHWEHQLFMIGPNLDYIKCVRGEGVSEMRCDFYYSFMVDGEASLVPEPDGLRLISNCNHDFIQRIPGEKIV